MGSDSSNPLTPELQDEIDRLNFWCVSVVPDVANIETDFQTDVNLIRLLQALVPDSVPKVAKESYDLTAKPTMKEVMKVRKIALDYAKDLGLKDRKFSVKSISTIEQLVLLLNMVVITFGSGTNRAMFGKSWKLGKRSGLPPNEVSEARPELADDSESRPELADGFQAGISGLRPEVSETGPEAFEDTAIDDAAVSAFEAKERDFERMEQLGVGSFGQVHMARETRTGAIVALKRAHKQYLEDRELESFNREVRILASIRHPALLRLCSYVPANNPRNENPAIAIEFARYGPLENFIQGRAVHKEWDLTQRYIVAYGIAVGMMVLHKRFIIHRELNPDNVLIDEHFEPKIGSFANSKAAHAKLSLNQTAGVGTPLYQAPEILEGEPYGREVDVYAFGIIFNATITGEAPYQAMGFRNPMLLVTKVMEGVRPTLAPNISPKWTALIERCWNRHSDRRPTFEGIVTEMSNADFVRPAVDVPRFLGYQKKVVTQELWCRE
jgi:hypothetical protein